MLELRILTVDFCVSIAFGSFVGFRVSAGH